MARYVLLAFNDNTEADAFVASFNLEFGDTAFYSKAIDNEDGTTSMQYTSLTDEVSVRAVFGKPTLFCECVPRPEKSLRGKKWGWWVCVKCSKPKRGVWQHPRNILDDRPVKERDIYLGVVEGGEKYAANTTSTNAPVPVLPD